MELVVKILGYVNGLADVIGVVILGLVQLIVPATAVARELATPIGWLALLTAGVVVAEVAKKLTWLVVGVGWLLIVIRIVMVVVQS